MRTASTRTMMVLTCTVMAAALALPAAAQQASTVLPNPPEPYKGTVNLRAKDSTPDFPQVKEAPAGAPNILLILLDDLGYGATATFGGPISTPTLQRIADNGLKYTRFHTTSLCSPTRAALLTGRNHHSAHTGVIMEGKCGSRGLSRTRQGACASRSLRSFSE